MSNYCNPPWGQATGVDRPLGFTLLEVLFAITVLSLGLLGTSAMMVQTVQQQSVSANRAIALSLARERLEQMKQVDIDNVTAANFPSEPYQGIAGNEQFQRTVVITEDLPMARMKTVNVTVTWRTLSGTSRNVSLNTILAPPN